MGGGNFQKNVSEKKNVSETCLSESPEEFPKNTVHLPQMSTVPKGRTLVIMEKDCVSPLSWFKAPDWSPAHTPHILLIFMEEFLGKKIANNKQKILINVCHNFFAIFFHFLELNLKFFRLVFS